MEIDFTENGDTEGTWLSSLLFMELKSNLEQNKTKLNTINIIIIGAQLPSRKTRNMEDFSAQLNLGTSF